LSNLPEKFRQKLFNKYEGTRLGRQELHAEILEDFADAFLSADDIQHIHLDDAPDMIRMVVAVDPAAKSKKGSDDTGISLAGKGTDGNGYILSDQTCHLPPSKWARKAVNLYHRARADKIIAEANNGGEMVKHTIHSIDPNVPVKLVNATRGKVVRFEPVASLYQQGRVKHVGRFPVLEQQLTAFTPSGYELDNSPDNADAAIWALTELLITNKGLDLVSPGSVMKASRGFSHRD